MTKSLPTDEDSTRLERPRPPENRSSPAIVGARHGAGPSKLAIPRAFSAASPPRFAESLRLSGQCQTLSFPPRRLEGSAFQPAGRRFFRTNAVRKGQAFPQDRRLSRGLMGKFTETAPGPRYSARTTDGKNVISATSRARFDPGVAPLSFYPSSPQARWGKAASSCRTPKRRQRCQLGGDPLTPQPTGCTSCPALSGPGVI